MLTLIHSLRRLEQYSHFFRFRPSASNSHPGRSNDPALISASHPLKHRTHISAGVLPPLLDEPPVDRVEVVGMLPILSLSYRSVGGWDAVRIWASDIWETDVLGGSDVWDTDIDADVLGTSMV